MGDPDVREAALRVCRPRHGHRGTVMQIYDPLNNCAWDLSGQVFAASGSADLYMFSFNFSRSLDLRPGS